MYKILLVTIIVIVYCRLSYAESISLNWDAPTTNSDNTPLTDLTGFKIYQGTSTGVYDAGTDVGMRLCTVISNLTSGITYYFVATAYDSFGNESNYSNEVSKLITTNEVGDCSSPTYMNWHHKSKSTGGFGGGFQ
jgi:hypothetical protein